MERYLLILLSSLAVIPGALLCYAPMRGQLRFGVKKTILFCAGVLAAGVPLWALIEYKFFAGSDLALIPLCAVLFVIYYKTLYVHISQALLVFSVVFVWLFYMNDISIIFDALRDPTGAVNNYDIADILTRLGISTAFALLMYVPVRKYAGELITTFHDYRVWYTASGISVIFIFICSFLMPLKYETLYVNNVFRSYIVSTIATFVLHLLLCVIFCFIISGMIQTQKAVEQNRFYEMRESHYLKQQRYIDENARVRHDFKHTIRAMKQLADKEDFGALKEYIDQYFDSMPENDVISFCHDHAVNAVLNYYHQLAVSSGIDTNWSIDIPETVPIKSVDLCNIIGNVLDNAITACQSIPEQERMIQLTVTERHHANLYIVATNTFSGKVKIHDDRYLSTSREGSGIGLTSIESIAESYGGNAEFCHKDREFYINIVLPTLEEGKPYR